MIIKHKKFQFGQAPFRFYGIWSAPSKGLLEQNPTAYNNAMSSRPVNCRFSCDHCGMGIVHHCMIKDANGKKFSVGSSCIDKIGDVENLSELAAIQKEKARKKRKLAAEKKREIAAQKAKEELERQREVNGGLTDHEVQLKRGDSLMATAKAQYIELSAYIVAAIQGRGNFAESISRSLSRGELPSRTGKNITIEIAAKSVGGRLGSKAYNEALPVVTAEYEKMEGKIKDIKAKLQAELEALRGYK